MSFFGLTKKPAAPLDPKSEAERRIAAALAGFHHGIALSDLPLTELPESFGFLKIRTFHHTGAGGTKYTRLPSSIGNLDRLWLLDLYQNALTQLPETIGNLGNLNLMSNLLTQLPATIGNLSKLHTANFSYNKLTTLPETFGQLTNLCELDLSKPFAGLA